MCAAPSQLEAPPRDWENQSGCNLHNAKGQKRRGKRLLSRHTRSSKRPGRLLKEQVLRLPVWPRQAALPDGGQALLLICTGDALPRRRCISVISKCCRQREIVPSFICQVSPRHQAPCRCEFRRRHRQSWSLNVRRFGSCDRLALSSNNALKNGKACILYCAADRLPHAIFAGGRMGLRS